MKHNNTIFPNFKESTVKNGLALILMLGLFIGIYTIQHKNDSSYSQKESIEPDSLPAKAPIDTPSKVPHIYAE